MADVDTITPDVSPEGDTDSAYHALLKKWGMSADGEPARKKAAPAEEPEHDEEETTEEDAEEDAGEEAPEDDDEESEEEDGDETPEATLADDDHEVVVKVDGKETKVKVGDLKRLWGQEASLTQKSQEVADARRVAEEQANKHVTALTKLHDKAKEAFEPYSKIDWGWAQTQVNPEQLKQLRAEFDAYKAQVDYFGTELDDAVKGARETSQANLVAQAKETLAVLNNKEHKLHIPDFEKVYQPLREYAVKQGAKQEVVDNMVDPVAWNIMHKAYMYDQGQKATVKKLTQAPKNIVNKGGNNSGTGTNPSKARAKQAMERLVKTGDRADAAEALLARWRD